MRPGRRFTVLIKQNEEGYFVATVPARRGWRTHAKNLDALMKRECEVIALCLEDTNNHVGPLELVGVQQIYV